MHISFLADKVGIDNAYKILSYYYDVPIGTIRYKEDFDIPTDKLNEIIELYTKGKPLNKIFSYEYFYGEKFIINENVLAPRQDTELVVEKALEIIRPKARVLDMCTGSGCIGLSIAKHCEVDLILSDISERALAVAKQNADRLGVRAEFVISDCFDNIQGAFDCIVSNPPYIRSSVIDTLETGVKEYDPIIALDGGADGLDFYRTIRDNFERFLKPKGCLILEIGFDQAEDIGKMFSDFKVKVFNDYGGNPRVAVIERF